MRKDISIQIDEELYTYVNQKVSRGDYKTPAEVIEAGLRLLEKRAEELDAIRQALMEGEASGEAAEFDFDNFLKRMHAARSVELTSALSDKDIAAVENAKMEGGLDH